MPVAFKVFLLSAVAFESILLGKRPEYSLSLVMTVKEHEIRWSRWHL